MNNEVYLSTWGDDVQDGVLTFYYILNQFYHGIKIKGSFEKSCVSKVWEVISNYE